MLGFSSDADVARYEPGVFGNWFLSSQVLCGGDNGIVAGTQFTASGVDFTVSQVAGGGILWLQSADGTIAGVFEIVSVNDAGHLTVSVMRTSGEQAAIPVGIASGLTWRIVTYGLQGYEVLWQMSQKLGLRPGYSGADYSVDDIVNADSLRTASVFGVLVMVFQALYQGVNGQEVLREKMDYYQWLYDMALERITVKIDTDDDGDAERILKPGVICLVRR